MFRFFHGYTPDTWDAQVKSGLVRNQDGIRICQIKTLPAHLQFNEIAARGTRLYGILRDERRPMYIDRLQGGGYIDEYPYDYALLNEYRRMLGDGYMGMQMHEWMSNYASDLRKLSALADDEWTEECMEREILRQYPMPYLFLESMTAPEMVHYGRPRDARTLYANMTAIYQKRMAQVGALIPCDSYWLAYQFELESGARHFMPEVGAQTPDARLQVCYARGMARAYGAEFGVYYEPWGGDPFSTCCYDLLGRSEWGISGEDDFPFSAAGPNGGSSRSLQERIMIYAYMSNAGFVSEEWGLYNTMTDWEGCELSEYGLVKQRFLRFTERYADVGDKLTPAAVVLPRWLGVLDDIRDPRRWLGFDLPEPEADVMEHIKLTLGDLFSYRAPMLGNEVRTLINSDMPDAIDILNDCTDAALSGYDLLIDLTGDAGFAARHADRIVSSDDLTALLREALPCHVEGGLHWMVNRRTTGGYYLTVFNNSGVMRSVAGGEQLLSEARKTVTVTAKEGALTLCEQNGSLLTRTGEREYSLTVPAGGWCMLRLA